MAPGTFRQEPHISRHPFGRVPVLQHGDFMLYETQAIMRYIDRVLPAPSLTPANPKQAARMDQLMSINDWYFFQGVSNVIGFQRIVGPRFMGIATDEAACAAAMPNAHKVFDEFGRLLADQLFFAGEEISLADLLLASHLGFFEGLPEWEPLTARNSNIGAWLARMNARQSFQATTWERTMDLAKVA